MKKMISQTKDNSTLKPYQNDYTDVSTENSSQHSIDSSFQEKSTSQNGPNDHMIQEDCSNDNQDTIMIDESKSNEKQSKITYYKKSVQWLGKKYKRFKLKIQTLYLAVSYIIKYITLGFQMKYKCQLLSAVCLLLAAKINQIHFPSIKSILGQLDFFITKTQILSLEEEIVKLFSFQMGIQRNSYSIVHQFFLSQSQERRKNAEKLLFLAIAHPQTLQFGQIYLGLSIVYLLKPDAIKETAGINRDKMKKIAFIVYNMYKQKKNQLQNKENCGC